MRLCIERILPRLRSRPVVFDLPRVETAEDIVAAYRVVLSAVSEGQLTLEEAERFASLLEATRKAIETVELAADIAALKERERWADVNQRT